MINILRISKGKINLFPNLDFQISESTLLEHQYYLRIVYDFSMTLSSYRMHRIYLAATMGYGLGSDDPEELAYYNRLRKEMDDMKKDSIKKGIPLTWDIPEGIDNESE